MKHFVFGSNGMMGKYFCSVCDNIVPLTRSDYDITENNIDKIEDILKSNGIQEGDAIVNCAGAVKQRQFTAKDYVYINSLFPHQLDEISKKIKCKFVHITTDCVYDGSKGNYTEKDRHTCDDLYGSSKSLGETKNGCCIRTSIIGLGSKDNVSLLDWITTTNNKQIKGFENHFWNGLTCLELSIIIRNIIRSNVLWRGCRHVFSNPVSKYELLKMYNDIFNLNKKIVPVNSYAQCDRTLNSKFHLPVPKTIKDQLKELKKYHDK